MPQAWSLPARSLKSGEGHRQVKRPLQFGVVRGECSVYGHMAWGSLHPVLWSQGRSPGRSEMRLFHVKGEVVERAFLAEGTACAKV